MTVATFFKLDLSDVAALQAVCNRLGLALPGLTLQTRCLRNCALMGPNATLDESTVRESIMTGTHFLGCASCGTYQRHNGILQVLADFLKREWGFTSCDNTMHGNHVGSSGTSERYTDGQFHPWESPHSKQDSCRCERGGTKLSKPCRRRSLQAVVPQCECWDNLKGSREGKDREIQGSMHSARTDFCSGYLHHHWGHRGAVPTTAMAPALEAS